MKFKSNTKWLAIEKLDVVLKETFSELRYLDVSGDYEYFYMEFDTGTKDMPSMMRKLDRMIKPYLASHGDKKLSYVFNINKGKELINIIRYNEKGYGHKVEFELVGRKHSLFIVDLLGVGDYTVFNQDFETLGLFYRPIQMPAAGQYRMSKLETFADTKGWTTSSRFLKPHLSKIVDSIYKQLELSHI